MPPSTVSGAGDVASARRHEEGDGGAHVLGPAEVAHGDLALGDRFGYLCLFNPDLLGLHAPLSLDDFLRFPHIMTSLDGTGRGVIDEALAAIGRARRLAASTPRFTTVAFHVQAAPIIATMVDELALTFARQLGLETSPAPVHLDEFTYSMLWHASYDQDPTHRWLREILVRLGREAVRDQAKTAL